MKIRLIKGWNGQSPGAIVDPPIAEVAKRLIERGIAEAVVDEAAPKPAKQSKKAERAA